MVPDKIVLNPRNTQTIRFLGLSQTVVNLDGTLSAVPINDATLEGTLYDGDDRPVAGMVDIVFNPVGSPPVGDYFAQVDPFDADPGGDYVLVVDGSKVGGSFHIEYPVEIENRES
jgi:hypothetical protein